MSAAVRSRGAKKRSPSCHDYVNGTISYEAYLNSPHILEKPIIVCDTLWIWFLSPDVYSVRIINSVLCFIPSFLHLYSDWVQVCVSFISLSQVAGTPEHPCLLGLCSCLLAQRCINGFFGEFNSVIVSAVWVTLLTH